MPNYNSSIIAGLSKAPIFQRRQPSQVSGVSPLSGMRTQGTLQPDPSQDLYGFQGAMGDELREREFNNARVAGLNGPGFDDNINVQIAKASTAPLQGLRKSYEQDMEASPLTQQRKDVNAWDAFDREATSLGFEGQGLGERTLSPGQERNIYARNWAETAAQLPLEQALAQGEATRDAARIKAQGDLAVKAREAQMEADKYDRYEGIAKTLGVGGQNSGRQVTHFGMPGFNMSFSNDDLGEGGIPTRLLTDLTFQRYAVNAAKSDTERSAADAAYRQSQFNALHQARNVDPEIKTWVADILADPATASMDFDDIVNAYVAQAAAEGDDNIPDEMAFEQARSLLRTLRAQ